MNFLEELGLIESQDTNYIATRIGRCYLREQDPIVLYNALRTSVKGFDTILRALAIKPRTDEGLMELLVSEFEEYQMGTPGVVTRHREWLQMIGYVEQADDPIVARITHATVLDQDTAAEFTDAVGCGDVTDAIFPHVMFLEPIYETDLHRSIWKRLRDISLKERVPNRFNGIKIDLIGEISTDGIGVGQVVSFLTDVINRGPASEDLVQFLRRDRYILPELQRKFLIETVDDKIKQVLFF
ncbi:hypothetical protein BDK88_0095 [Natrinema hispanicum]|uniref:Uncharacterized protein n=1 Tax=Natrinema hispanicum TaxID=392421 RepID=A0A482YDL8_9EURY|nr:hypothetical protein BDK88_0095 [Natrinema hispanicum]